VKVFVIQPNLSAKSEVWLYRMNQLLENNITGLATFLHNDVINFKYPIFNLNGRPPSFWERQQIRLRLFDYDYERIMRHELQKEIKASGAELLIVHFATTAHYLWNVLEKLKLPIFIYVHGYDIIWDHNDDTGKMIHSSTYSLEVLKISQNPNVKFIVSSFCSFHSLVSIGISESKIRKKIFGVRLPDLKRNYVKSELQILYLGRFVDYKGPDIVLNAFLKACDAGFKGTLVMAGDGTLKIACEIIANRSAYANRIKFTGAVTKEQAVDLYKNSDIYTMHNIKGGTTNGYDTFGVTFIEAMSFGLPIITAPIGGPAEIIENGVDGILVSPNNEDEHAEAFMQLFNNTILRKELGERGRLKVSTFFTPDIEKQELYDILGIPNNK
jgi:colanic acid/amylovoran biosynthesis glycosyltransferase